MKTAKAGAILSLYLASAVSVPFLHRTLIDFMSHPFLNAAALNIAALILTFAVTVATSGLESLQKLGAYGITTEVCLAGLFFSSSLCLSQFCYFGSSVDFVVMFSFFSVVFHEILKILFGETGFSAKRATAVAVIAIGLLFMVSEFGWSVSKSTACSQIALQLLLSISVTLYEICYRKVTTICYEMPVTVCDTWILTISAVVTVTVLLTVSSERDFGYLGLDYLTLVTFGALMYEIMSVCSYLLSDDCGCAFADLFVEIRCLPILAISYVWYNETEYTVNQTFGIVTVIIGYVGLSGLTEHVMQQRVTKDSEGDDTASLLSGEVDMFRHGIEEESSK